MMKSVLYICSVLQIAAAAWILYHAYEPKTGAIKDGTVQGDIWISFGCILFSGLCFLLLAIRSTYQKR